MPFELSKDHEDFRAVVREFAQDHVAPHVAQWDREHYFPVELIPRMGQLGLFGLVVPEEYGGSLESAASGASGDSGGAFTSLCVAIEELGRVDQSVGITLSAGVGLGINPILTFGTDEQKARWLPDLVAGRALAAFGLTEPDGGSDAGATQTRARLTDDGSQWSVDGAKAFITNSGTDITSVVTVTARTGVGSDGKAEVSAILVPSGTPGFTVEPAYDKLGWHASDTHGLSFADCRVPASHLLGRRGDGFRQFLKTLDDGRIAISALALGLAQACLELTTDYSKTRLAFGAPIGSNQGVAFQVADLAVAVEAARLLDLQGGLAARRARGRPSGPGRGQGGGRDRQAALE